MAHQLLRRLAGMFAASNKGWSRGRRWTSGYCEREGLMRGMTALGLLLLSRAERPDLRPKRRRSVGGRNGGLAEELCR
jgi:hypothetical protein